MKGHNNETTSTQLGFPPGRTRARRCTGVGDDHPHDRRVGGADLGCGWSGTAERIRDRHLEDSRRPLARSERGSAVVDFLLVSVLLTLVVLAVAQLALALHVRTLLTDAASEGARYAALYGSDLESGRQRVADLIEMTLPHGYSDDIVADLTTDAGVTLVSMKVTAPLPVIGFFGLAGGVTVTGRAVAEWG